MSKSTSRLRKMNNKHRKIVDDYENQKSKHLEKLASKSLDNEEKLSKLKEKPIDGKFLKNF